MACPLRRAWRHDLLARGTQLVVHPLSTQVAVVVRSGVDDRGSDPSLHRDGGGSTVCRFTRPEHGCVRFLPAARLPVAATVESHPFAKAVPTGDRQGGCLREPATDPDPTNRLGTGPPAV